MSDAVFCLASLQGLIKIRGDKCWLDLTCMDFHYEVSTDLAVAEAVHCSPGQGWVTRWPIECLLLLGWFLWLSGSLFLPRPPSRPG